MPKTTALVISVPNHRLLDDNKLWTNRFEIKSASSGRIYVIAQNKNKRHWGCSCPGWRRHRNCTHLKTIATSIGLHKEALCFEKPKEIRLKSA